MWKQYTHSSEEARILSPVLFLIKSLVLDKNKSICFWPDKNELFLVVCLDLKITYCLDINQSYRVLKEMSQQSVLAAQKTNCTLGYIKRIVASRSRKVILPLNSSEIKTAVQLPALVSPVPEKHGSAPAAPKENHRNDQRAGVPLLRRKAEKVGLV